VKLDAIPLDSKWRDALVLYAEVCSDTEATRIANYCWSEMTQSPLNQDSESSLYLRHVHCLRYLNDAFHGRLAALEGIQSLLFDHVRNVVMGADSLLVKKIAVESIGLLPREHVEEVIVGALEQQNEWLSETAFNACRFSAVLSSEVIERLAQYLIAFTIPEFLVRFHEINFALQLAPGMRALRRLWWTRLVDAVSYGGGILLAVTAEPLLVFVWGTAWVMINIFQFLNLRWPGFSKRSYFGLLIPGFRKAIVLGFVILLGGAIITAVESKVQWAIGIEVQASVQIHVATDLRVMMAAALTFPIYQVVMRIKLFARGLAASLNTCVLGNSLAYFAGGLIWLMILELMNGSRWFGWIAGAVVVALTIGFIVTLVKHAVQTVKLWYKDRQTMRVRVISSYLTREDLEHTLILLRLERSRVQYLSMIEAQGIQPIGIWSGTLNHNMGGRRSETLLAKLDARWLGIDR
jgi:hypothetical protein